MREIKLNGGYVALVDDEDYDRINKWRWSVYAGSRTMYAYRTGWGDKKKIRMSMHRVIIGAPMGMDVDHIDGDGLNNTKENLRICTGMENCHNRRSAKGSSSKHVGVYAKKSRSKVAKKESGNHSWAATIRCNGHRISIGTFSTEDEAAVARDIVAIEYFGDFAKLNFPEKMAEYKGKNLAYIKELSKQRRSSSFTGLTWCKNREKWRVTTYCNNIRYFCGSFDSEIDAAMAYDLKSIELRGIEAHLNFPEKLNEYLCVANGTEEVCYV